MTRRLNPGAATGASLSRSGGLGWQEHAACIGLADLFFGPDDEGPLQRDDRERRAKRVCAGCLVAAECRAFGESLPVDLRKHSVFGGIAETDRRRMLRRVAAARRQAEGEVAA